MIDTKKMRMSWLKAVANGEAEGFSRHFVPDILDALDESRRELTRAVEDLEPKLTTAIALQMKAERERDEARRQLAGVTERANANARHYVHEEARCRTAPCVECLHERNKELERQLAEILKGRDEDAARVVCPSCGWDFSGAGYLHRIKALERQLAEAEAENAALRAKVERLTDLATKGRRWVCHKSFDADYPEYTRAECHQCGYRAAWVEVEQALAADAEPKEKA